MDISQGLYHVQGIVQKMMVDLCLKNLNMHLLFIQTALVILLYTLGQAAVQPVKTVYHLLQFLIGNTAFHSNIAVIGGISGIYLFTELPYGAGQPPGKKSGQYQTQKDRQ